jgi:hypothetical protein
MGLLKSVDNVQGIDFFDYRDDDYWSKYTYRARITFEGIRYVYWANNVDEWVARLKTARKARGLGQLTQDEIDAMVAHKSIIENFIKLRKEQKKEKHCSIRLESDTAAVFSNDLNFLHSFKQWDPDIIIDFTQVQKAEFSGTKYFVNDPPSKYRVYLKSKRVDDTIHKDLRELFSRNKSLKPSKALQEWVKANSRHSWRYRYCSSAYSIDYDDESTLSYLALCHGDLLGKKYKLEKRPEAE